MVRDEIRDPFEPDDIGSPSGIGVARTRLCIVSRDPLHGLVFVEALTTALSPRDGLEIIVDRRRGGSVTDQPSIERRHHPHFAHALERDGFAIVPTRAAQPVEHRIPAASPIERLDPQDAEEHRLKRFLEDKRQRKVRLSRWVILPGLMGVILGLLVPLPALKTLMSRARAAAPPLSDDQMNVPSAVAPVPQVAETPSPTPSRAPATATHQAARIRRTTRAAAAASAAAPLGAVRQEQPRATQGQAIRPEPQGNAADDPRSVVDWLFNR